MTLLYYPHLFNSINNNSYIRSKNGFGTVFRYPDASGEVSTSSDNGFLWLSTNRPWSPSEIYLYGIRLPSRPYNKYVGPLPVAFGGEPIICPGCLFRPIANNCVCSFLRFPTTTLSCLPQWTRAVYRYKEKEREGNNSNNCVILIILLVSDQSHRPTYRILLRLIN